MNAYSRKEPAYSLCGLNCALCPRFHTEGLSRCPGCGGPDFALKHPTCAVITCNGKHDNVEFCYTCSAYPCKRYAGPNTADSFISYRNVLENIAAAQQNLPAYLRALKKKQTILEDLITRHNDGKSKGFYCLGVDLLPLMALEEIVATIDTPETKAFDVTIRAKQIRDMMMARAESLGIELRLRK